MCIRERSREYGLYRKNEDGTVTNLAMPVWHWGKFYEQIIRLAFKSTEEIEAMKGKKAVNYWWGMSADVIDVCLLYTSFNSLDETSRFDILRLDVTWLSWFAQKLLRPLSEIDENIENSLGQYVEGVPEHYCRVHGQIYALPVTPSVQILYYRKEDVYKRQLFIIDEIINNQYVKLFVSNFQIYITKNYPVYLVMAGLYDNISNLQNEKSLTFLYRAPKIFLEPLSIPAVSYTHLGTPTTAARIRNPGYCPAYSCRLGCQIV